MDGQKPLQNIQVQSLISLAVIWLISNDEPKLTQKAQHSHISPEWSQVLASEEILAEAPAKKMLTPVEERRILFRNIKHL